MPDPKDAWIYWEDRLDEIINEVNLARENGLISGYDYTIIMNNLLACETECETLEDIENTIADAEAFLIKAKQKVAAVYNK
jgi:hypothetical protein